MILLNASIMEESVSPGQDHQLRMHL